MKDRLYFIATSLGMTTASSNSCLRVKRMLIVGFLSSSCVWIHNKSTGRINSYITVELVCMLEKD